LVKDTQTITAETRQRLEAFYAPYGARLQGLVQSYRVRMLT
jgi:N-formylglutamate amidohydrolase